MSKSKARNLVEFLRNINSNAKLKTDAVEDGKIITSAADLISKSNDTTSFVSPASVTSYIGDTLEDYVTDAGLEAGVGNITTSGYLRGPAIFTIDPAAHGDDTGKVVIAGDLQVDGTTTTINSTTVSIDDKNIVLADNAADASEANGAGITINGADATMTYNSASSSFDFNNSIKTSGSLTIGSSGPYEAGSIYSNNDWGMLFRAKKASPFNAEYRWANSADTELMRIDKSGNLDLESGGYKINGTTVIDSSRNLTNIDNISSTGGVFINTPAAADATIVNILQNGTLPDPTGGWGDSTEQTLLSVNDRFKVVNIKEDFGDFGGIFEDDYVELNNTRLVLKTPSGSDITVISGSGYISGTRFNIGSTTVIDSSRNLTNIGTITNLATPASDLFWLEKDSTTGITATIRNNTGGSTFRMYGDYDNNGTYCELQLEAGMDGDYAQVGTWTNNSLFFTTNNTNRIELTNNGSFIHSAGDNSNFVINEGSADCDFRLETNNKTHAIFVEGSTDRIGFGVSSPDQDFSFRTGNADWRMYGSGGDLYLMDPVSSSSTRKIIFGNTGPGAKLNLQVNGTITGGVTDLSSDGNNNVPFQLSQDYNSWMVRATDNWGLFWAGNAGAAYGTNGSGGPGNIWGNSSNPNEFAFVSSLGTMWSVHGATGNTWQKGSAYIDGDIRFSRGASDYSNYIRAANYPSQGYTSSTAKYWIEYGSKGGQHFVLNTDGGSGAGENTYDDFTIWQGAIDGDRLLSCSNAGNVDITGKITSQGFPVATFRTADNTYQLTLGVGGTAEIASELPGDSIVFGSVHLITTDVDQTDHFDVSIGEAYNNSVVWSNATGAYPNNLPPSGTTTVSHLGDNQGVLQGHYGAWTPVAFRVTSTGAIRLSVEGNNASARVSIKVMGYITR